MRKDQSVAVPCQRGAAADLLIDTSQSSSQCGFEDNATARRGHVLPRFSSLKTAKKNKKQQKKRAEFSKNHVLVNQEAAKQWRRNCFVILKGLDGDDCRRKSFQSDVMGFLVCLGLYFFCLGMSLPRRDKRKPKKPTTHNKDKHSNNKKKVPKNPLCCDSNHETELSSIKSHLGHISAKYRRRCKFITGTAEFNFGLKGSIDTRWRWDIFPVWPFSTSAAGNTTCRLQAGKSLAEQGVVGGWEKKNNNAASWLAKHTPVSVG